MPPTTHRMQIFFLKELRHLNVKQITLLNAHCQVVRLLFTELKYLYIATHFYRRVSGNHENFTLFQRCNEAFVMHHLKNVHVTM